MLPENHKSAEHFPNLPLQTAPLWLGFVLPPAAFLVQLTIVYAMAPKAHTPLRMVTHVISALMLILALLGGAICLRHRHSEFDRVRFTANLGLLSGVLYALVILAEGIATFMLDSTIF